jgi:hypothetical protein
MCAVPACCVQPGTDTRSPAVQRAGQRGAGGRAGANHAWLVGRRDKKMLGLIQKQDRLLYVCFYLLLNLAEDVSIEKKMRKKVRRAGPTHRAVQQCTCTHFLPLRTLATVTAAGSRRPCGAPPAPVPELHPAGCAQSRLRTLQAAHPKQAAHPAGCAPKAGCAPCRLRTQSRLRTLQAAHK